MSTELHAGYIAGSMLADLGRQAEDAADTRRRALQAGKAADAFFKALPEDQLPMPADVWHLQSPLEKASAMVGLIQAQGFKKQQLDAQELSEVIATQRASRENAAKEPAFIGDVSRFAPPGALPYDMPAPEFDRYALPDGQAAPGVKQVMDAASRTGYQLPAKEVLDAFTKHQGLDLSTAFDVARNPPGGFQPGKVTVNPNGTPGLQFDPTVPTPQPTVIPPGLEPKGVTVDPTGKATTTYGITDRSKALTDAQANALQFSERMKFNNNIIEHLEGQGFNPASVGGAAQGALPNFLAGEASQQYTAAARNWISAVLRKESGAAISKGEETAAREQYFPKLGDGPAVIKQKAALRQLAEENMRRATGNIDKDADAARRVDDVRKAVQGNLPTATRTSQKTKGTVYQTPLGALKWTGTGWEAP